jgi:hypothetical protein
MAGMVAVLAVAVGAAPATAGPGAGTASTPTAPTSWVVENLNPDPPFYELESGSVTLVDNGSGAAISCQTSGGWGRALPRTIPQEGAIGENWGAVYDSCTGPGAEGLEVQSVYIWYGPTDYDPETDTVTGWASADLWALGLIWPDCEVDLYNVDPSTHVRMTYDNRSRTLTFGPITASVDRTSGAGRAGRPQVGDVLTFETALGVAAPGFTVRPA